MKTLALVVGSVPQGENNKILTLLTPTGKTNTIVYRGLSQSNPLRPLTEILTYSSLELSKGKGDLLQLKSGEIIESFYDLRLDYDKLKQACDIAKIAKSLILTDVQENLEVMQLTLNTIYIIQKLENYEQIKSIFLCRLLSIIGYMAHFTDNETVSNFINHIMTCNKNKIFSYMLDEKNAEIFRKYINDLAEEHIYWGDNKSA